MIYDRHEIGKTIKKIESRDLNYMTSDGGEARKLTVNTTSRERAMHRGIKALKATGAVLVISGVLMGGDAIMVNKSEHEPGHSIAGATWDSSQGTRTNEASQQTTQGTEVSTTPNPDSQQVQTP